MSASRVLRRASGKQLQFAGPWLRGRSPATTDSGHSLTASSLLIRRSTLHRPMLEKLGRDLGFVTDVELANTDLYLEKYR